MCEQPNTNGNDVVVQCAIKQLGKPYARGTAGPNTFDMGGLPSYCYNQAGISVPQDLTNACFYGKKVPASDRKPGDLYCRVYRTYNLPFYVAIITSLDEMIVMEESVGYVSKRTYSEKLEQDQDMDIITTYVTY
uniref:NlpC/P60 family protein n=1 Tax=Trepomonas sp. PC1 TaxID=1076344 RepID=A0A146K8L0_9EUKA|eukprot:JAP91871.1 NlpC/P60 family protein [Trepomonas sp. PC1]